MQFLPGRGIDDAQVAHECFTVCLGDRDGQRNHSVGSHDEAAVAVTLFAEVLVLLDIGAGAAEQGIEIGNRGKVGGSEQ